MIISRFLKIKQVFLENLKFFGQITLTLIVGLVIVFNDDITIKEKQRVKILDQDKTIVVFSESPKKVLKNYNPLF